MSSPRLDHVAGDAGAEAVVLVLHGGQQSSTEPVLDRHASWWRMHRIARALAGSHTGRRLEVHLLQNSVRGWNGPTDPAPVRDARWALDELRERIAGRPVVLVGHSMGGRTACRVADDPSVRGVVALAPWLPAGEPIAGLRDRTLHVLHGTADRWTSAAASRAYVERARTVALEATWESLPGVGHFMFRRVRRWNGFVEDSVAHILAGRGGAAEEHRTEGRA